MTKTTDINEDFRLRIFLTLAREGSFTKTAAALGITQPGVSQNISELERIYRMKLFNREKGAVSLTREGEMFREHALRIEGAYGDAAAFAENVEKGDTGGRSGASSETAVHSGKEESLAEEMVRGMLPVLRKMNPELALKIGQLLEK